jgi:hypothetical protein
MGGDEVETSELLALRNGGNWLSGANGSAWARKKQKVTLTAAIVIESWDFWLWAGGWMARIKKHQSFSERNKRALIGKGNDLTARQ